MRLLKVGVDMYLTVCVLLRLFSSFGISLSNLEMRAFTLYSFFVFCFFFCMSGLIFSAGERVSTKLIPQFSKSPKRITGHLKCSTEGSLKI